jgi:hypothetical protein
MRVCWLWRTGQCPVHQAEQAANQPLSGIHRARSAIIHRTVRWVSGATANWRNGHLQKQIVNWTVRVRVRAEKSERTGLSGATTRQRLQRSTRSKPQRACWRGAHRTVNSDCPVHHQTVHCAHRQQTQPTARKWLEAINTPKPPPSIASKYSEHHIHCNSKGNHSKDTSKAFNPIQATKSTLLLRDLREDHLCSFVALVAWIAFSPSHSYS